MSTPSEDKLNIIIDWLMEYSNQPNVKILLHQINLRDNELFTNQEFQNLKPNIKEFLKKSNLFNKLGNNDYYELSLEGKKIVENGGYLHYLRQNELENQIKERVRDALNEATLQGVYISRVNLTYTKIGVIGAIIFGVWGILWGIYQNTKSDSKDEEIKELQKKLNIKTMQYESQQKHLTKIQEKIDSVRSIKVDVKK